MREGAKVCGLIMVSTCLLQQTTSKKSKKNKIGKHGKRSTECVAKGEGKPEVERLSSLNGAAF